MDIVENLKSRAKLWPRGNTFEDFTIGRAFTHHWGRTLTQMDSTIFTTLKLHYNPQYLNAEIAAANGYERGCPINPLLVFNTVFGLSVEDLSEGGGPFLGVDDCIYGEPVYTGDTLTASSEVISARESDKRPDFGIVTWATRGLNQNGQEVIRFRRSNLVRRLNTQGD
jgi:acyl dehydratase